MEFKWSIEQETGKITIEASSKWEKTRNKNDRTVEKKIPEEEDNRSCTPNLLKEWNFMIFDQNKIKIDDQRQKVLIQSNFLSNRAKEILNENQHIHL
jgi:hypothetical protein